MYGSSQFRSMQLRSSATFEDRQCRTEFSPRPRKYPKFYPPLISVRTSPLPELAKFRGWRRRVSMPDLFTELPMSRCDHEARRGVRPNEKPQPITAQVTA